MWRPHVITIFAEFTLSRSELQRASASPEKTYIFTSNICLVKFSRNTFLSSAFYKEHWAAMTQLPPIWDPERRSFDNLLQTTHRGSDSIVMVTAILHCVCFKGIPHNQFPINIRENGSHSRPFLDIIYSYFMHIMETFHFLHFCNQKS